MEEYFKIVRQGYHSQYFYIKMLLQFRILIYLFSFSYLKAKETKKNRDRDPPMVILKYFLWPGLDRANARSQEFHPALPYE